MSLLDGLFLNYETSISDLQNPELWLVDAAGSSKTKSGERINHTTALGISSYFAAIRAISEDIAKLPLKTYRRLGARGKREAREHPLYSLLHDAPNSIMTSMSFRETLQSHILGWGNGYALKKINGRGVLQELEIVHPLQVQIQRNADKTISYRVRRNNGEYEVLNKEGMFHVHGLGDDGIQGYSVARIGVESLGLTLAAQTFGSTFYGHGAVMSGVLTHPGKLDPEALNHLRTSFQDRYSSAQNAYKVPILEEGMKWERSGIPPEEAQFLQSRQFQVDEMARWFRMPPHKLQSLVRSTYSNIEHQSIEYVQDTLLPWMIRWEQSIKMQLMNAQQDEDVFVAHTVQGLLRGDQAARARSYSSLFQIGCLSQNDIRDLEDQNPIGEEGDVYYVPSNLTRSKDASQGRIASSKSQPPPSVESKRPQPAKEDKKEDVSAILAPLWEDAAGRILRKETKAAQRAVQKYSGVPEAWHGWLDTFYAELNADIQSILTPAVRTACALSGMSWDVAAGIIADVAQAHVVESRLSLGELKTTEEIAALMNSWTSDRQASMKVRFAERFENGAKHDSMPCAA